MREPKGLQDLIDVTVGKPLMLDNGWKLKMIGLILVIFTSCI